MKTTNDRTALCRHCQAKVYGREIRGRWVLVNADGTEHDCEGKGEGDGE